MKKKTLRPGIALSTTTIRSLTDGAAVAGGITNTGCGWTLVKCMTLTPCQTPP